MSRRRAAIWLAALVVGLGILPASGRVRRPRVHQGRRSERVAVVHRLGRAAGQGDVFRRPRPGGCVHRRSPARVGREACRGQPLLPPDRQGPGREDHEPLVGDGDRRRTRRERFRTAPASPSRRIPARAARSPCERVEFAGYGLDVPGGQPHGLSRQRRAGTRWSSGSALTGPKTVDSQYRRVLTGRARYATDQLKALRNDRTGNRAAWRHWDLGPTGVVQTPLPEGREPAPSRRTSRPRSGSINRIPPRITASDAFLTFLFSKAPVALRRAEAAGRGAGAAAVVHARGRDDHVQRRRHV